MTDASNRAAEPYRPMWITREAASRRLGVSLSTIDRLRASGDLVDRKVGRSVRISVASVDAQPDQETEQVA